MSKGLTHFHAKKNNATDSLAQWRLQLIAHGAFKRWDAPFVMF